MQRTKTYKEHLSLLESACDRLDLKVKPLYWGSVFHPNEPGTITPLLVSHVEAARGSVLRFQIVSLPEWTFFMQIPWEGSDTYFIRWHSNISLSRFLAWPPIFYWEGTLEDLSRRDEIYLHHKIQQLKFNFVISWYRDVVGSWPRSIFEAYKSWYLFCWENIWLNFIGEVANPHTKINPFPFKGLWWWIIRKEVKWNMWRRK